MAKKKNQACLKKLCILTYFLWNLVLLFYRINLTVDKIANLSFPTIATLNFNFTNS